METLMVWLTVLTWITTRMEPLLTWRKDSASGASQPAPDWLLHIWS